MCSMYWNLTTPVVAPCGHEVSGLQTHFMGEAGSCVNWYAIGEPVEELGDFTGRLSDCEETFCASCDQCQPTRWYDFDAEIDHGRVVRVLTELTQEA